MKAGIRVEEASNALRAWLRTRGFTPGARIPAERKIAIELGKSHSAINRAVCRLVGENLLIRDGYKLYYSSDDSTSSAGAGVFAYVAPEGSSRLKITQKVARQLKHKLQVFYWDSMETLAYVLQKLHKCEVAGVILDVPYSPYVEKWKPGVQSLLAANICCICSGQPIEDLAGVYPDFGSALEEAFEFFVDAGHAELALLSSPHEAPSVLAVRKRWNLQCRGRGMLSSLPRIHCGDQQSTREDARNFAELLTGAWKEVTGLIVHDREMAPLLLEELATRGRRSPRDISLISLGDSLQLRTAVPPISCLYFDEALHMEMTFRLLESVIARTEAGGRPGNEALYLHPQLLLRGSTSRGAERPAIGLSQTGNSLLSEWPTDPEQLRYRIESLRLRPFPLVANTSESRFQPIDLSKYLNRPLPYRLGWLGGLPLHNLKPGKQRIHGAVFQIAGGPKRTDYGAVVFRSLTNSTGGGKALPVRVRIEIKCRAKAIYIFHGSGQSQYLRQFATYAFHTRKGLAGTVPMTVLGRRPAQVSPEEWNAAIEKANIQDWWPDLYHADFPNTRMAVIPQDEANMQGHRYLYTLEWINPVPEEKIEFVEVSSDPKQTTTLGLLGITVLKS